ncbi:MAG: response regulator [Acidimicrobiales bacterium]
MTHEIPASAEPPDPPRGEGWGGVDLAAMWVASKAVLEAQAKVIERAVVAGIEQRLDREHQAEAAREAHKLAGSLGTFGFADGSRLARALELALPSSGVIDPMRALSLSRLVVDLQAELARPLAAPAGGARARTGGSDTGDRQSLLVVDGDADRGRRVVEAAAGQGLRAGWAETLDAARRLVDADPPAAVAVDARIGPDHEVSAFLAELSARRPAIAIVVLVDAAGVMERVRVSQAGAALVLDTPVPPDIVVEAVTRLLVRHGAGATVLALDDDPTFLAIIAELLGAEGLIVEPLHDPDRLWEALASVQPDLLLLDNDMPGADGISLCRAVRGDARWSRLPIVFLSGSDSRVAVRAMFAAGADDFVSKPVSPDDLVNRVVTRIERSRTQSEQPGVDLATGLPGAPAFMEDAARLLSLAASDSRPAVLALVELDPPRPQAMFAMGRLLRQAAEPVDAVGAWSGGRLAAVLYRTTGTEASIRLAQVLQAAKATPGGFGSRASVGLAVFPDDGLDTPALGAAAEAALGRARQAPGDAVELTAPAGGAGAEVVDVLLVDDDDALGALVVHALSGRGWSVRWLKDGAEALALLETATFRARAVLLDIGLPGLDGLAVLRRLAQRGTLATTRVVMLTVRTNEGEVLESLDLGAFDHVAKPFSLSVLMHRVRRAIDAEPPRA